MNFEKLIATVQTAAFFETYWERSPLHVETTDPNRFAGMFSRTDMDRLLAQFGHAATMDIRLARFQNGREETVDIATEGSTVDIDRLFAAYCDGFTINLNQLEQRHIPSRELAISLSETFGCPVNVNAYLTPARSPGFPLHFDTHSVLVLQVEGMKSWQIYAPRFPLPIHTHQPPHQLLRDLPGTPMMRPLLKAGDVLYVPKGFGHEASPKVPSLHLTIALQAPTCFDLIRAALDVLVWDMPLLRQSIRHAARTENDPTPDMRADFQRLREVLAAKIPLEEAFAVLEARRLAFRSPAMAGRFETIDPTMIDHIEPHSHVRKRPDTPCSVIEGAGWVAIQYPSHRVEAALAMYPALEYIAQVDEFTVVNLPGHISDDEKVALVRRLVVEGLLLPEGVRSV